MSWHSSVIFVQRELREETPEFLTKIGFQQLQELPETVDCGSAGSYRYEGPPRVCVGYYNGWTILFNTPHMFGAGDLPEARELTRSTIWPIQVDRTLAEASANGGVLAVLLEGSTAPTASVSTRKASEFAPDWSATAGGES